MLRRGSGTEPARDEKAPGKGRGLDVMTEKESPRAC